MNVKLDRLRWFFHFILEDADAFDLGVVEDLDGQSALGYDRVGHHVHLILRISQSFYLADAPLLSLYIASFVKLGNLLDFVAVDLVSSIVARPHRGPRVLPNEVLVVLILLFVEKIVEAHQPRNIFALVCVSSLADVELCVKCAFQLVLCPATQLMLCDFLTPLRQQVLLSILQLAHRCAHLSFVLA